MSWQLYLGNYEDIQPLVIAGGPARIKGIIISYAAGGTVSLRDGGSSGVVRFSFTAPAIAGNIAINMPGDGIRCQTSIVAMLSGASITVIYG